MLTLQPRVLLMDLSQAAFGLDLHEASRIYFISPVLNPQVEAQAIGRVRRISQKRTVSVETLVLKNSIDEVILDRKRHMAREQHEEARSMLDIRPIYDWVKNARITPLGSSDGSSSSQTAQLLMPQPLFDRKPSRPVDEGQEPAPAERRAPRDLSQAVLARRLQAVAGKKRIFDKGPGRRDAGDR